MIVRWPIVHAVNAPPEHPQPSISVSVPVSRVAVQPDEPFVAPVTVSDSRWSGRGTVRDGGHLNPPKPLMGMTAE